MPPNLVAISPNGWGNDFYLDTSSLNDEECPVVFWSHEKESGQEPEFATATFVDWVKKLIHEELDYERSNDE